MWIINLFRNIFGYVNICLSGDFCERLLNLCAKNHISLWNIKRKKDYIYANISAKNFKKIKSVRNQSHVHIKILEKHGLPFIIKKYKIRWGIPVGIAIFFSVMIFLQSFIWQIYTSGNINISEKTLLDCAEKIGIKIGTPINRINTLKNKEELLINVDGIAWASLNIEGCRLTINISETVNLDKSENLPSNIYAKTDAVIKKIDIKSGIACVKKGDAVLKGDLLVSGVVELPNAQITEHVKAKALVIGETTRTITTKIYKKSYKLVKINGVEKKTIMNFFGIYIPLYLGNEKPPYSFKQYENNLTLFGQRLPIGFKTKNIEKLEYKQIEIDFDSAKSIGYERINNIINDTNYVSYNLLNEELLEEKDYYILSRKYKCEENIGYEENFTENNLK